MPRFRFAFNRDAASPDELRQLLILRRESLDAATALVNGGSPLPVSQRWGWRSTLKTLGRDRDGSLLASVTVEDRDGAVRMLRNVRLVRSHTLKL